MKVENKTPKNILDAIKRYNKKYPERIAVHQKKWREENKDKMNSEK